MRCVAVTGDLIINYPIPECIILPPSAQGPCPSLLTRINSVSQNLLFTRASFLSLNLSPLQARPCYKSVEGDVMTANKWNIKLSLGANLQAPVCSELLKFGCIYKYLRRMLRKLIDIKECWASKTEFRLRQGVNVPQVLPSWLMTKLWHILGLIK